MNSPDPALLQRLATLKHLALDLDGTVYRGRSLFPWTHDFFATLKELGIGRTFLTNNSSKSVKDYLAHLNSFDLKATESEIYTSTQSAIAHLREQWKDTRRLFVLGTASMQAELSGAGYEVVDEEPELVVVGFPTDMTHERLSRTAYWIARGVPYIATHPDRTCPTDLPLVLVDCGSLCACLQTATGIAPRAVLGKPDPIMLRGIMDHHGLAREELGMVGDRVETDIGLGHRAGVLSVLVLSGASTADDATRFAEPPDLIVPSLKELGELLKTARCAK